MGIFYKESSYKNFHKFFRKKGFKTRNDGPHLVATYPKDESLELSIPRSKSISNGVTEKECEKLIELGFDPNEIKKYILK